MRMGRAARQRILDSALGVVALAQDVAFRHARGLATSDEAGKTRQLIASTLPLLYRIERRSRRFLESDELRDFWRVQRLCRRYDIVLWELSPECRRGS